MSINNTHTIGYETFRSGRLTRYIGTNKTESPTGQKVCEDVLTVVEDDHDRLVVWDKDYKRRLQVGFQQQAEGRGLAIVNRNGNYMTQTFVPLEVSDEALETGGDLSQDLAVSQVSVQEDPKLGTQISLAGSGGSGERHFWLNKNGAFKDVGVPFEGKGEPIIDLWPLSFVRGQW